MSAASQSGHLLGSFRFAKVQTFDVYGDHVTDPKSLKLVLDDGIQTPYRNLRITAFGRLDPASECDWLEGWITPGDP